MTASRKPSGLLAFLPLCRKTLITSRCRRSEAPRTLGTRSKAAGNQAHASDPHAPGTGLIRDSEVHAGPTLFCAPAARTVSGRLGGEAGRGSRDGQRLGARRAASCRGKDRSGRGTPVARSRETSLNSVSQSPQRAGKATRGSSIAYGVRTRIFSLWPMVSRYPSNRLARLISTAVVPKRFARRHRLSPCRTV